VVFWDLHGAGICKKHNWKWYDQQKKGTRQNPQVHWGAIEEKEVKGSAQILWRLSTDAQVLELADEMRLWKPKIDVKKPKIDLKKPKIDVKN